MWHYPSHSHVLEKIMKHNFIFILVLFCSLSGFSAPLPSELSGTDILSKKSLRHTFASTTKATVIIFLSAKCPCSASHEEILKGLQSEFKDFTFIGIHSNSDEPQDITETHFKNSQMTFPILEDQKNFWANQLGALKTPHAFVINPKGEIIYQGGVTNSHIGPTATTQFLKEVLADLSAGKAPRQKIGRALGCYIQREE